MKTWQWILIFLVVSACFYFGYKLKPEVIYINLVPVERNDPFNNNVWEKK